MFILIKMRNVDHGNMGHTDSGSCGNAAVTRKYFVPRSDDNRTDKTKAAVGPRQRFDLFVGMMRRVEFVFSQSTNFHEFCGMVQIDIHVFLFVIVGKIRYAI